MKVIETSLAPRRTGRTSCNWVRGIHRYAAALAPLMTTGWSAQMHHQLAAVIAVRRVQPYRRGKIGAPQFIAEAHMRSVGMGAIFHPHLIAGEQRRRDMTG